ARRRLQCGEDLLRDVARLFTRAFRGRERAVALETPEVGAVRERDLTGRAVVSGGRKGVSDLGGQILKQRFQRRIVASADMPSGRPLRGEAPRWPPLWRDAGAHRRFYRCTRALSRLGFAREQHERKDSEGQQ